MAQDENRVDGASDVTPNPFAIANDIATPPTEPTAKSHTKPRTKAKAQPSPISNSTHATARHVVGDVHSINRAQEADMADSEPVARSNGASNASLLEGASPTALAPGSAPVPPPEQSTPNGSTGRKPKPRKRPAVVRFTPPPDAEDMEGLFDDPLLGDGLTEPDNLLSVSFGKPKNKFIRVHPDKSYRRRAYVYGHKDDGEYGEKYYIIDHKMLKHMREDAQPCVLAAYVDRAGNPGIWVLKLPRVDQKDCTAWQTARMAARRCIDIWGKPMWTGRGYKVRPAAAGYAADPDWSKLPSFEELCSLAVGESGVIKGFDHPIYRDNIGLPPVDEIESSDDGSADDEMA
jgi:hypothetical protein